MRILVDNGVYAMQNLGDIAMLQVAAERLEQLGVAPRLLTAAPQMFEGLLPGQPVDAGALTAWQKFPAFPVWRAVLPRAVRGALERTEAGFRTRHPRTALRIGCAVSRCTGRGGAEGRFALDEIRQADAVIAAGGGYLADEFKEHALVVLTTLALAQRLGKPTALFSQGMGPVEDPTLRAALREVLPRSHLIALREGLAGRDLVRQLGVDDRRVRVTGDDAIEPAWRARLPELGTAIGINMRRASYAPVSPDTEQQVAEGLREAARHLDSPLVPVPVSLSEHSSDVEMLRRMFVTEAGINDRPIQPDPADTITRAGSCRIVVTGSYHAAVFALAQGVTVIGLAQSAYYTAKFAGLQEQFGEGCHVLRLDAADLARRLVAEIGAAWKDADRVRPALLRRAERQIALSREAYHHFHARLAQGEGRT